MKKILSIFLCLFALFLVVGCDKEEKEYDLSQLVFEDATYDYDGKAHSVYVQNLPDGLQVEYEGNSQKEVGSYTVKATIKYGSGEKLTTLTAKMTIRVGFDLSDVTFVDKEFAYDGKAHSIEVENLPDGITVEYKNNGQTKPGRYVVKATLLDENGNVVKYLAARIIITGDGTNIPSEGGNEDQPSNGEGSSIDVSGVVFEGKEVDYDGSEHKIECTNVPEGVIVTYLMNAQTEPGKYDAVAVLTDAETMVELTRLFATLTINSVQQPEPEPEPDPIPVTGFHVVVNGVNGEKYYALTKNNNALDPSFDEYYSLGVTIESGDIITLFNADTGDRWAIQTPDGASSGSWTGGANGITCGTSGTYDIYVKMKWAEDQIYFGPAQ